MIYYKEGLRMRFIGRKSELSKLDAEYNRDSSFVVSMAAVGLERQRLLKNS